MKTKFILSLFLIISIFTVLKASAWVEPKQGEEIPAVLNTSSDGQEKKGWLSVNNWIRVMTNPFSFDVGVESPKFCIKKPDGTTSCCPPEAGQDWSACGGGGGKNEGLDAKWVWNSQGTVGSFDLITNDPNGIQIPLNDICSCYNNGVFQGKLSKITLMQTGYSTSRSVFFAMGKYLVTDAIRAYSMPREHCFQACQFENDICLPNNQCYNSSWKPSSVLYY